MKSIDRDGELCPIVTGKAYPTHPVKVLNLYAGLGGNRDLWENCSVTSVEYDDAIAEVYAAKFPHDKTVVGDALEYVQSHFKEFDFIWASPPCPTHGQYRHNVGVVGKGFAPVIPDMTSLYGLIVFLQTYFAGKWCVENVRPYYAPLIQPTFALHRHLFWANFYAEPREFKKAEIRSKNKISDFDGADLVKASRISNKRQALRNCVDAQLGLHIFNAANVTGERCENENGN
jgi:DNA (cytosine-5)-methyltransferase 1